MDDASYNESRVRQLKLRHLFYPGAFGLVGEAIIALLALILFNLSDFSSQLLGTGTSFKADPVSLWYQPFQHLLDKLDGYAITQRAILFLLWSVVGILLYILVFRLLQILFSLKQSVDAGVELVRKDQEKGLVRWLGSLHDFFVKALMSFAGLAAMATGSFICFSVASQELRNGLVDPLPTSAGELALSFIGAFLSVRFIALGLTLASRHFRNWYLY
jgi:hypothetical protein